VACAVPKSAATAVMINRYFISPSI
jgi:hypothetical protein